MRISGRSPKTLVEPDLRSLAQLSEEVRKPLEQDRNEAEAADELAPERMFLDMRTVVDLNLPLPLALAWRRDDASPLLASFIGEVQRLPDVRALK